MMTKGELIAQGRTGEVFAWGQGEILKLYLPGLPVGDADREYAVSRLVQEHGVPTPCAKERLTIEGRHGIVFERVSGPTMLQLMVTDPTSVPAMARRLAEMHHQVHQIRAAGLPSQKEILKRHVQTSSQIEESERVSILRHLGALPEEDRLCHGDFHPDNMLIVAGEPTIIDWLTGAAGSPASDVVRSCILFITASPPPGASAEMGEKIAVLKGVLYGEYLSRYLELSGLGLGELEQWVLPVAAARLTEGLPEVEKEQLRAMVKRKLAGDSVLEA